MPDGAGVRECARLLRINPLRVYLPKIHSEMDRICRTLKMRRARERRTGHFEKLRRDERRTAADEKR